MIFRQGSLMLLDTNRHYMSMTIGVSATSVVYNLGNLLAFKNIVDTLISRNIIADTLKA